jgi:hypothetical protein
MRYIVVSDGWVSSFSDGFIGGTYGFGKLIGQNGNVLLGEHLFGYLLGGATLVPQYVIRTQATVISEEEYRRLRSEEADYLGWTDAPGERAATRIYFKDVAVKEARQLAYSDTLLKRREGARAPGPTLRDNLRWHTTIERFRAAESKLKSLALGTDFWEASATLDMTIVTLDSGMTYEAWFADGYLGGVWAMLTTAGYFKVWRFGYLEYLEGQKVPQREVPKLALIFKNNRVHKVVPYGTLEELIRHFE